MIDIHLGDCLEIIRTLPDGSVDCAIVDPPYGDTSLAWDRTVTGWVEATARVLKPTASMWVFGSMRFLVSVFVEAQSAGLKYSQDIVWEKQNGTGFHADRFRRVHEHAVMFYRGAWRDLYRETQYTNDATRKTVRRKTRPAHTGNIDAGHYVSEDGGPRMMRSVLQVRNEHGRAVHPTQKPEDLVEPLVRYSCPVGGVVLDPFAGSGTTGVVAVKTGRHFIGIERDPTYFQIAKERIQAAQERQQNNANCCTRSAVGA